MNMIVCVTGHIIKPHVQLPTINYRLSFALNFFIYLFNSPSPFPKEMPNINQTLFIVIFSLIAFAVVLLTYVCWLKRMKIRTKQRILDQQHKLEEQQNINDLSSAQLQELKPVLLQKLYATRDTRQNDALVDVNDASERDAQIIVPR
jgi:hypothetical protein